MPVGLLTLTLHLPGCTSLKEKRGRIRPILARLHRQFNVSAAEVDALDRWQHAVLACAVVSNDAIHNQRVLQEVVTLIEQTWPDAPILEQHIASL